MIILLRQVIDQSLADRFWSKVNKSTENGCWLWTAAKDKKGYGRFGITLGPSRSRVHFAHRIAAALYGFPITDETYVLHKCDNPSCVNPDHLWLGTHKENMEDWRIKGYRHRKNTCNKGHPRTPENTRLYAYRGYVLQRCRKCHQ